MSKIENKKDKKYFNPSVTVDVVIFTIEEDRLKILLIDRANKPFQGKKALPGGFMLKGETTKDSALRILEDKAGVEGVYIEQLYTFDDLNRDPRGQVLSVVYFAIINRDAIKIKKNKATENPVFFSIKDLPSLAFDHGKITAYALLRLRYKLEYTNIVFSLLQKQFTLSQLQKAYEIILNNKLDKRNFRKKFLALGLVRPVKGKLEGGRQRPAQLYSFISNKPMELKRFF